VRGPTVESKFGMIPSVVQDLSRSHDFCGHRSVTLTFDSVSALSVDLVMIRPNCDQFH